MSYEMIEGDERIIVVVFRLFARPSDDAGCPHSFPPMCCEKLNLNENCNR